MVNKDCSKCGCTRKYILKAILLDQESKTEYKLKNLCVYCLLGTLGIDPHKTMDKESRHIILETIKQK